MAKPVSGSDGPGVSLAVRGILAHPHVRLADGPTTHEDVVVADFAFDLSFGSRWRAQGKSPFGVYPIEKVRITFPATFPNDPPEITLRDDFSRNHPHVQPYLIDGRVVPCVVDIPLSEFIASSGYERLAEQIWLWLRKASEGRLIEGGAGWEPARRDSLSDWLIADEQKLRSLATPKGGFAIYATDFLEGKQEEGGRIFFGELGERTSVREELYYEKRSERLAVGHGLALVLWAGTDKHKIPLVCDEYLPDDIATTSELQNRLVRYGVSERLQQGLSHVNRLAAGLNGLTQPLYVVVLVRRPNALTGTSSDIEICAYVVPMHLPEGAFNRSHELARPVAVRTKISPDLLRSMSGEVASRKWVLLGAGSLGSKVAIHLAREGSSPLVVADTAWLAPHNAARHGLIPDGLGAFSNWQGSKAGALTRAIRALSGNAETIEGNHIALIERVRQMRGNTRPQWLLNATASLATREALSRSEYSDLPVVVEMSLYNKGSMAFMGVEGEGRNPCSVELIAELYNQSMSQQMIYSALFTEDGNSRVSTGQGCGSYTMVMPDARLSSMASMMAESFRDEVPGSNGSIRMWVKNDQGGVDLLQTKFEAFTRVAIQGLEGWEISFSSQVKTALEKQISKFPFQETGGVLFGYVSLISRRMVVTQIVDAPEDSVRTPTSFILGAEGLEKELSTREERTDLLLRRIGTWHSHLGSSYPSQTDRETASKLSSNGHVPAVLLISGSDGYSAISGPLSDEISGR